MGFRNCRFGLRNVFSPGMNIGGRLKPASILGEQLLLVENYPASAKKLLGQDSSFAEMPSLAPIATFKNEVYLPTLEVLRGAYSGRLSNAFELLKQPAGTFEGLRYQASIDSVDLVDSDPRFRFDDLKRLVFPDALILFADRRLRIGEYEYLYRSDKGKFYSPEEFGKTGGTTESPGLPEALEDVLDWVDLAIAQSAVLSGNLLIPRFYDALLEYDNAPDSLQQVTEAAYEVMRETNGDGVKQCKWNNEFPAASALCVLESNEILAKNYLRYSLVKDLEKSGSTMRQYGAARERDCDPFMLNQLTGVTDTTLNTLAWHFKYVTEPDTTGYGNSLLKLAEARYSLQSQRNPDLDPQGREQLEKQIEQTEEMIASLMVPPRHCQRKGSSDFLTLKMRQDQQIEGFLLPDEWYVQLGDRQWPLPTFRDVVDRQVDYQSDLYNLIELRGRLERAITYYRFYEGLDEEERLLSDYYFDRPNF